MESDIIKEAGNVQRNVHKLLLDRFERDTYFGTYYHKQRSFSQRFICEDMKFNVKRRRERIERLIVHDMHICLRKEISCLTTFLAAPEFICPIWRQILTVQGFTHKINKGINPC